MKKINFLAACLSVSATLLAPAYSADAPPRAYCQVQVLLPALYRPLPEDVMTFEGSPSYQSTPPVMEYGTKKVKIADGYTEYTVVPATFAEVAETVEVERERVVIESIPATYKTITKRVKVSEAHQTWNPACAAVPHDGTTLPPDCLLNVPAQYQEIQAQVIDMPPRTVKKIIPARTEIIKRKVVVEPAKVVATQIPPAYTQVRLSKVSQSARVETTLNPSRSTQVMTQQVIRPERMITTSAWCENQLNSADIQLLQLKLKQLGYFASAVDGNYTAATRTALLHYQAEQQLATGAITRETLQKLGIQ